MWGEGYQYHEWWDGATIVLPYILAKNTSNLLGGIHALRVWVVKVCEEAGAKWRAKAWLTPSSISFHNHTYSNLAVYRIVIVSSSLLVHSIYELYHRLPFKSPARSRQWFGESWDRAVREKNRANPSLLLIQSRRLTAFRILYSMACLFFSVDDGN